MVEEMIKLRKALDDAKIKWWDQSDPSFMDRTKFEIDGVEWSVINGRSSYGGYSYNPETNEGLLELMTGRLNDGEPIGWLTADEIMVRAEREAWKEYNDGD